MIEVYLVIIAVMAIAALFVGHNHGKAIRVLLEEIEELQGQRKDYASIQLFSATLQNVNDRLVKLEPKKRAKAKEKKAGKK
jgi:hypothetical protein